MVNLVIVESPTKAKTLKKFLGQEFLILPSLGHVKDLPKRKFGIEVEKNFKANFVLIPKRKKIISQIKKTTKNSKMIYFATDPDREGEKIAFDLWQILNLPQEKYQRIVFHEITKEAINNALKNPRKIDLNLVLAQETRRILDRIVGYKLSPFLWAKVAKRLSAGRVQSVALRLIVEREIERENFQPKEYWTIKALLEKESQKKFPEILAILTKRNGKEIKKLEIDSKEKAQKILDELKGVEFKVGKIEKKEVKRNPLPPFTTATLQQTAFRQLRWSAKFTMAIAQQLYEKGFTTYHRTDSLNLSESSLLQAKKFVIQNYGQNYWAGTLKKYKTKSKLAQEAHEAIRPTFVSKTPEILKDQLDKNQLKLYDLIWRRFLACQMKEALFDSMKVEIEAKNCVFQALGQVLKFDGFLKVYPISFEQKELPPLENGEILRLIKFLPQQHFTQPPPRYTEASLIKELEKNGIGRPSTYSQIISVIQERNYVQKDENRFLFPTEIGRIVNELLLSHFPEIVDVNFTAKMEEDLDKIAQGQEKKEDVLKKFYFPFEENLKKKYEEISKKEIKTEKKCPQCSSFLVIKFSKYGKFLSCSRFPQCTYTENLQNDNLKIKCPKCSGEIVQRKTKKGKIFYGCSNFPNCDFALWEKPIDKKCPQCGAILIETKKGEIKCSNKNCAFKQN